MKIACTCPDCDRRYIDDNEAARLCEPIAQLITQAAKSFLLVAPRPVGVGLQAGTDQFEIEHRRDRLLGARRNMKPAEKLRRQRLAKQAV